MNVLFVANDPTVFDKDSATRARMRMYAEAMGQLHIVSYGRAHAKEEVDGTLFLYPVAGSKLLSFFGIYMRARALMRAGKVDVVSAQDPFEYGLIAHLARKNTNTKLHVQIHTDFLSPWFVTQDIFRAPRVRSTFLNSIRLHIARFILPRSEGIRVVSQRIADGILKEFQGRTVPPVVLPVPVTLEQVSRVPLPEHPYTFTLVTVGRLEKEKRIQDILYALARIQQRYPRVGLFVIGEGRERRALERLTAKLGLKERVVFLGERADARGLMKNAHAYIQASAYEGYGRTLLEAALARVPIITTDVGIVGEVFRGYDDVLSTPVGDPVQLSNYMVNLIEDQQLRLSLAINAEHKALHHLEAYRDIPRRFAEHLQSL